MGLLLRREGIPVEVWDAGTYPRHRVCGEFVSGRGLAILSQLGVPELSRGIEARSVQLFYSEWGSPSFSLPDRGLSIDRATLDAGLANAFSSRGGVLRTNQRWAGSFRAEGLVRATGRRPASEGEAHFVGLKVHASDLPLGADLELHFSNDAYVGLSSQENGTVNICGLFRKTRSFRPEEIKTGDVFRRVLSSKTKERLGKARFDGVSVSAVAGISLKRETTWQTKECRIGDSVCMIPPLTGNGMSIAIESASLAAPFLCEYSRSTINWEEAQRRISQNCERQFRKRLLAAALLQNAAFTAIGRRFLMYFLQTSPSFFGLWFRLTR